MLLASIGIGERASSRSQDGPFLHNHRYCRHYGKVYGITVLPRGAGQDRLPPSCGRTTITCAAGPPIHCRQELTPTPPPVTGGCQWLPKPSASFSFLQPSTPRETGRVLRCPSHTQQGKGLRHFLLLWLCRAEPNKPGRIADPNKQQGPYCTPICMNLTCSLTVTV